MFVNNFLEKQQIAVNVAQMKLNDIPERRAIRQQRVARELMVFHGSIRETSYKEDRL